MHRPTEPTNGLPRLAPAATLIGADELSKGQVANSDVLKAPASNMHVAAMQRTILQQRALAIIEQHDGLFVEIRPHILCSGSLRCAGYVMGYNMHQLS